MLGHGCRPIWPTGQMISRTAGRTAGFGHRSGSSPANPFSLNASTTSRAYCAVAANIAPPHRRRGPVDTTCPTSTRKGGPDRAAFPTNTGACAWQAAPGDARMPARQAPYNPAYRPRRSPPPAPTDTDQIGDGGRPGTRTSRPLAAATPSLNPHLNLALRNSPSLHQPILPTQADQHRSDTSAFRALLRNWNEITYPSDCLIV
jgi:hypothetical protein